MPPMRTSVGIGAKSQIMDSELIPKAPPIDEAIGARECDATCEEEIAEQTEVPFSVVSATTSSRADAGECLYLGPAGQRCERRAPAPGGGFCAMHQRDGIASRMGNPARVLAAAVTIVVLLWPYVEELVHEIIRWKHSR